MASIAAFGFLTVIITALWMYWEAKREENPFDSGKSLSEMIEEDKNKPNQDL